MYINVYRMKMPIYQAALVMPDTHNCHSDGLYCSVDNKIIIM